MCVIFKGRIDMWPFSKSVMTAINQHSIITCFLYRQPLINIAWWLIIPLTHVVFFHSWVMRVITYVIFTHVPSSNKDHIINVLSDWRYRPVYYLYTSNSECLVRNLLQAALQHCEYFWLGRILIPKAYRNLLNIRSKSTSNLLIKRRVYNFNDIFLYFSWKCRKSPVQDGFMI